MERRSRRRRERAQRLAERRPALDDDEEDTLPEKARHPPRHRKRKDQAAPLSEEDIIDGFAIVSFKAYEDIEICLKSSKEKGAKVASTLCFTKETPSTPTPKANHKIKRQNSAQKEEGLVKSEPVSSQDPSTSDDAPPLVKREPSEDRLSDASSRCSSGRGYICDSEGDDDKASDAGSILFSVSPPSVKKVEPVEPPPGVVVNGHGGLVSPKVERRSPSPVRLKQPPTPPQPPPANNHYPPPAMGNGSGERGRGPAYPGGGAFQPSPPHPPLYAPYSSTPYLPQPQGVSRAASKPISTVCTTTASNSSSQYREVPPVTCTTTSHRDTVTTPLVGRTHSPRGHSPSAERDSYSSNVSSLSRGSMGTPVSLPPFSTVTATPVTYSHQHSSLPYSKQQSVWSTSTSSSVSMEGGTTTTRPVSGTHVYPPPTLFPPTPPQPQPPPVVSAAPVPQQPVNPIPFSAESLFQSSKFQPNHSQSDLLRRELDTRFLVSQDRGPYLRTEMHHHQHQHTHVHQHTTPILPPPPPSLYASPIYKEMPKIGVDSPFYRQSLGLAGYPGYTPGLLHPTLGPSTPFAPPTHIPTFTPKQLTPEPSKPKPVKTGKWNAMHVRIAWEIYHHQQKGATAEGKLTPGVPGGLTPAGFGPGIIPKGDLLRPPSHMFGPPHPFAPPHRPPGFEPTPPAPFPPVGSSMFARYPSTPAFPSLTGYAAHGPVHDPWSRLQPRGMVAPSFAAGNPWGGLKTEEERERERNRERARREEKQRRAAAVAMSQAKAGRDRSPIREVQVSKEDDVLGRTAAEILGRPPPPTDILGRPSADLLGRSAAASDLLGRAAAGGDLLGRNGPPTDMLGRPAPPAELLARAAPASTAAYLQQRHHARHPPLPTHYTPTPHWDHPYRYDPLRFNPLMSAAALREEEEHRAKLFASYQGAAGLRAKEASHAPLPPHPYPPKEESSQSR